MISGRATAKGSAEFARKSGRVPENYTTSCGLSLSNVGIGTYLGEPDARTDALVSDAVRASVMGGINVIDTAINYRAQKAERAVGRAIAGLISEGRASRDQLFVSTKSGYVTDDADAPGEYWAYVKKEYVQKGIIKKGEISSGYHCMGVQYLEDQLERSRANLNLECIDLVYLHNAIEGQPDMPRSIFLERLAGIFSMYERKRKEGAIGFYGMATWTCFRAKKDEPQYISMEKILDVARKAGGKDHGFRFIQMPFNLHYDQALLRKNQPVNGEDFTALEAAQRLGLGVFASVPLMQGRLLQKGVMPEFLPYSAPVRALQLVRSAPGVTAALVGHKSPEHIAENLGVMGIAPVSKIQFAELVGRLVGGK